MKPRTLLTVAALVIAALFILDVPAAMAATKYFNNNGTAANWDAAGVWWTGENRTGSTTTHPVDGDHAVIEDGETCNVNITTARADSFAVQDTGELNINAGQMLEIDSNSSVAGNGTAPEGVVVLAGADSRLRISASLTISGAGSIDGQNDSAKIEIAANTTLTITTTIEGNLQITEPPAGAASTSFVNNGAVHANNAGTLDLNVDSLGSPSGSWQVSTSSSAILKFSVGSTTMTGSFTISAGTLDVDANVTTSGNLTFTGGTIDVASSVTFQAS